MMPDVMDIVFSIGQFALLVIVTCIGIMLVISMMDRHPRDKD